MGLFIQKYENGDKIVNHFYTFYKYLFTFRYFVHYKGITYQPVTLNWIRYQTIPATLTWKIETEFLIFLKVLLLSNNDIVTIISARTISMYKNQSHQILWISNCFASWYIIFLCHRDLWCYLNKLDWYRNTSIQK